MRLRESVYRILVEATRRYSRHGEGKDITKAWTGLGYPSEFAAAHKAGLMRPLHDPPTPRIMGWWMLTDKGARIVQKWLDQGFDHLRIETSGDLPPREVDDSPQES